MGSKKKGLGSLFWWETSKGNPSQKERTTQGHPFLVGSDFKGTLPQQMSKNGQVGGVHWAGGGALPQIWATGSLVASVRKPRKSSCRGGSGFGFRIVSTDKNPTGSSDATEWEMQRNEDTAPDSQAAASFSCLKNKQKSSLDTLQAPAGTTHGFNLLQSPQPELRSALSPDLPQAPRPALQLARHSKTWPWLRRPPPVTTEQLKKSKFTNARLAIACLTCWVDGPKKVRTF